MDEALRLDVDAYRSGMRTQLDAWRESLAGGMPRFGWKVALNVPEVQAQLGVGSAGLGWLEGRRVLKNGDALEASPRRKIRVEAERALRIGRRVAATVGLEEARAAIDVMAPALELVDYALSFDGLEAIVGHSMFHYGTVLGDPVEASVLASLGAEHPRVRIDDGSVQAPRAELVPADPAESVRFCAAWLSVFDEALEPGDWILCGSYTTPLPLEPGSIFEADFGAAGGRLSVRMEREATG